MTEIRIRFKKTEEGDKKRYVYLNRNDLSDFFALAGSTSVKVNFVETYGGSNTFVTFLEEYLGEKK